VSDQTHKKVASKPHYSGHRERLRRRVLDRGGSALSDYEVIDPIYLIEI
jgi:DNA repair protein RadC